MSTNEKDQTYSYAGVHRDIAAGLIAGDLMRDGYFGKIAEAFGTICAWENKTVLLYGFDALSVALKSYDYLLKGAKISDMYTQSYHLGIEESEESVTDIFQKYVAETAQQSFSDYVFVEPNAQRNTWAGFTYEEDGQRKEFINGYFPRVLKKYISLADKNVSKIVFKENFDPTTDKKELRDDVQKMLLEMVN